MQQTGMSGWSQALAMPRLLYSSLMCCRKKGDFGGVTASAVRGDSALLRLMSSQFSVFLMHKAPLWFQHLNHFPFWSRYKQEGCLGFILWDVCSSLQRRRTYKLVHSFEGPTGFCDQLLIDHNVLSGNTSVIFTRSDQQMKSPLPSAFCNSAAVVHTQYGPSYVAGAPRHGVRGKVVVVQDGRLKPTLQKQVGSYFGSELCPLDVNLDGVTDLLLVGAPFYRIEEEGRVYVYRLETEDLFFFFFFLNVRASHAANGFTVASIGNIDRAGYEDVAVGPPPPPLEDQLSNSFFGSIYLFNADKDEIKSSFSQRVKASEISSGLQYFGQSIDGAFDFTNDGLQDITVGSLEKGIVLRLRPVVHFLTNVRFNPERILIFQNNSIVTAKLCFDTISALPVSQQALSQLYVLYTGDLDVKMAKRRVQFEDRNTTAVSKHSCCELQLHTLPCDFDYFSSFLRGKHEVYKKNDTVEFAVPVLGRYQPSEMHFQVINQNTNEELSLFPGCKAFTIKNKKCGFS
ncbi:LOW QUALITY PROTEIN: integrin alpha-E [Alca torda]